jgi:hypothetical protein
MENDMERHGIQGTMKRTTRQEDNTITYYYNALDYEDRLDDRTRGAEPTMHKSVPNDNTTLAM